MPLSSPPPMVGRAAELDQLREVDGRPPAVIVIEGEAGVGKSRLIREWLRAPGVAGVPALVGHCAPMSEPFSFAPLIDALAGAGRWMPDPSTLSPVAGALRALTPELSDRLPPPLAPSGDPQQERRRVFLAFREVLAGIGAAVLVLENLHDVDDATRQLLRFLLDRPVPGLTLVLSYRREDLADPHRPLIDAVPDGIGELRLTLRPLGPDQVRRMAEAADPGVSHERVAALAEHSDGIPRVIEELLTATSHQQVPSTLRDSVLGRASRAGRPARHLLHAAAVLETSATERQLAQVADLSAARTRTGLAELAARALLHREADGRYGFRQILARQVVYASIPEPTRWQLHQRAVTVLRDGQAPPDQLARHCRASGQVDDWHRYAEAAADQAMASGDDRTATQLLAEMLRRADDAGRDTRVRLAVKLGWAALSGRRHDEARQILRQSLLEPDLPAPVRGELRLCLGVLLREHTGDARQGRVELERAVPELAGAAGPAAQAMASLGVPYLADGSDIAQHLDWLARADREARQAADPQLKAILRGGRAAALVSTGDPTGWTLAGPLPRRGHAAGADPTDLGQQGRHAAHLAWAATCTGHYRQVGPLLGAGRRFAGAAVEAYLAGTALMYDHAIGNWQGLAARADTVVRTVPDLAPVVAQARLVRGLLAQAGGELGDADRHLARVDALVPVMATAAGALARRAAARGDASRAVRHVRRGLDLVRAKGVWCWAAELLPTAVSVLARADRPLAHELYHEFREAVAARDSPLAAAAVTAGRAILAETAGEHRDAARYHAEAAAAYRGLPRPYQAAMATEASGRCRFSAGGDGTAALLEAITTFERLGASWDLARCRHLLRGLGREPVHRRGRRGYGRDLSPRERDVVRLIRTGLTNREIADALFLSPRTVEAHVARALRKLGLPSRRVLARHTLGRRSTSAVQDSSAGTGATPPAG